FFDQSTNSPTAWQWSFQGGIPSASSLQNPAGICYDTPGTYDVTLITTSASGNDTLTVSGYVAVYPAPPIPAITQAGYTLTSTPAFLYQWQLNAVDIPGATGQSYSVLQSGYYTVVITDEHGCVNSTTLYVLISGIESLLSDEAFAIYPNPSTGKFVIEVLNGTQRISSVQIINALGEEVNRMGAKDFPLQGRHEIN